VVPVGDDAFGRWAALFPAHPAARAVIVVDVERVADSCVPALPGEHAVPPVGDPVPGWTPRPPVVPLSLHGRYVDLLPLDATHSDALFTATCGDARRWTYLLEEMPGSAQDFRAYVEERAARPDQAAVAIVPRGGEPSGIASWLRCQPAHGSVEVGGILFGPALARTAAATEAMVLMARHAFDLGYRRYEWKCDALNAPSRRAAARLGFAFEGVFRQAVVYKGRNRDTAWFSITDTEWARLVAAYGTWLDPANFEDPATGRGQRTSLSDLTRLR
jgi:RimJ/RimL family protein N-acetyltransferase